MKETYTENQLRLLRHHHEIQALEPQLQYEAM